MGDRRQGRRPRQPDDPADGRIHHHLHHRQRMGGQLLRRICQGSGQCADHLQLRQGRGQPADEALCGIRAQGRTGSGHAGPLHHPYVLFPPGQGRARKGNARTGLRALHLVSRDPDLLHAGEGRFLRSIQRRPQRPEPQPQRHRHGLPLLQGHSLPH